MKPEAPAWNDRTNARWNDTQIVELGERAYSEVHWNRLGWVPAMAWLAQVHQEWWFAPWLARGAERYRRLMARPPAILRRGELVINRKESARRWRSQNG